MGTLYHIEPIYKDFVWAGSKLKDRFAITGGPEHVGTIYCAIALPGELDNRVSETGGTLSELYSDYPELFACDDAVFPIRMTVTCNEGFQSYQLHPDVDYALAHEGCRGKVSGAVILDESDAVDTWLFGHKAEDREQFRALIEAKDWDNLFTTLDVRDGDFVHTPAGVIHGGNGSGKVTATFGTNSDITYRFYDNDRNDPARPLHIDDVCACACFPEKPFEALRIKPQADGDLSVWAYHDVPGEYTALRLKVDGIALFKHDGFLFIANVGGKGSIDGTELGLGQTLLVPAGYGPFEIAGAMDCIAISYRQRGEQA